jgi:pimeloyl-ACP methyl ester carboxylesterase
MFVRPHARALISALATVALAATVGTATAATTSALAAPAPSKTSALEAKRVDSVATPKADWFDCTDVVGPRTQCGTVELPLDYDAPKGAKTEIALLRLRVANPAKKVGTLFLNPGGPGGSGVGIAAAASQFLSPALLAKFDIVGFDPRGTNFSANVKCFKNIGAQATTLKPLLNMPFPVGSTERAGYVRAAEKFGAACSTTGKPLSASMSTAEVARDMDVLRRMVGDKKLTYLGFSYGTYLGNVYANLFPDRVRAVVIDGVLDPIAWAGRASTATIPQTQRLKSGEGASRALHEILKRCRKAGPTKCNLAGLGDPAITFDRLVAKVKKTPIVLTDGGGGDPLRVTYPILISWLLSDLYSPDAGQVVDWDLTWFSELAGATSAPVAKSTKAAARTSLVDRYRTKKVLAARATATTDRLASGLGFGFPYDNAPEAFQSVLCTDGLNPAKASSWGTSSKYADLSAPGFGPLWTWASAPCASATWTAKDEDAYRGSFGHRTSTPVLVVGNYWDPATNYDGAVKAASLLPNSRLLSSDSWGHTAYGTSSCVTGAVDTYLLTGKTPKAGKVCKGDAQPFTEALAPESGATAALRAIEKRTLPPVVAPLPGSRPQF